MRTPREPGALYLVAGAPAAGKSALRPRLVEMARGPIVMEMDELLEDGTVLGIPVAGAAGEATWPAYDRMWLRILAMVRRAGHPVILLCPTPSPDALTGESELDPPLHWALLDCSDRVRADRLRARGWTRHRIEEFLNDPGHDQVRELMPTVFRTDTGDPESVAAQILQWVTTPNPADLPGRGGE